VRVLAAEQSQYWSTPAPSGVTSMQGPQGQAPQGPQQAQLSISRGALLRCALTTPVIDAHALK
jgi:hypothetical protein